MGYRSAGAIFLSDMAIKCLPKELKEDLENKWTKHDDEGVWYFTSWKWNKTFSMVQTWESFMLELEESEIEYDFVRLGEYLDDNEIATHAKFHITRHWETD